MKKILTGNKIVDTIANIELTGNIIPSAWYHTILKENGTPHYLAIHILAEILYWYRPVEKKSEAGTTTKLAKKFYAEDYLQKSYEELHSKFNCSVKQVREAIKVLEALGVVKRHLRTVHIRNITCSNVMFLELDPAVLISLTFPDNEPSSSGKKHSQNKEHLIPQKEIAPSAKCPTYTKTSTQSKNIDYSTTPIINDDVVASAKEILADYNLSHYEIRAIVTKANGDLTRLQTVVELLHKQTSTITNVPGWIISALTNNYQLSPAKTSAIVQSNISNWHNLNESGTDYKNLEPELLDN